VIACLAALAPSLAQRLGAPAQPRSAAPRPQDQGRRLRLRPCSSARRSQLRLTRRAPAPSWPPSSSVSACDRPHGRRRSGLRTPGSAAVLAAIALGGRRVLEARPARRAAARAALARRRGPARHRGRPSPPAWTWTSRTALARHTSDITLTGGHRALGARSSTPVLTDLHHGKPKFDTTNKVAGPHADLPDLGPAPDRRRHPALVQTPRPLSLDKLKGRVVLIDFWTYTCNQLPADAAVPGGVGPPLPLTGPHHRGRPRAVVRVRARRRQRRPRLHRRTNHIKYPVVRGQRLEHLEPWGNTSTGRPSTSSTPNGEVRHTHFGEGRLRPLPSPRILALLAERVDGRCPHPRAPRPPRDHSCCCGVATPEYLRRRRAQPRVSVVGTPSPTKGTRPLTRPPCEARRPLKRVSRSAARGRSATSPRRTAGANATFTALGPCALRLPSSSAPVVVAGRSRSQRSLSMAASPAALRRRPPAACTTLAAFRATGRHGCLSSPFAPGTSALRRSTRSFWL